MNESWEKLEGYVSLFAHYTRRAALIDSKHAPPLDLVFATDLANSLVTEVDKIPSCPLASIPVLWTTLCQVVPEPRQAAQGATAKTERR
jgi:hypothetical protein